MESQRAFGALRKMPATTTSTTTTRRATYRKKSVLCEPALPHLRVKVPVIFRVLGFGNVGPAHQSTPGLSQHQIAVLLTHLLDFPSRKRDRDQLDVELFLRDWDQDHLADTRLRYDLRSR